MRKLATAAAAFSAAIFAACYILPLSTAAALAAVFAALGAPFAFSKSRRAKRIRIVLFSAAVGFAVFAAHAARTTLPAEKLDGETMSVNALLLDYPDVYDDYCRAEVKLDGAASHLKAVLYDGQMQLENAKPGQTLCFTARLRAADTRYGEDYDYYNSRGIYLVANARSDIELGELRRGVSTAPAYIRRFLTGRIDEIFPDDTALFMRSILLGDKSRLYDSAGIYTALTRAGFMHIAAVSGMHISFLVALLQFIMGKSRRASLSCIALIWCFVLITGSTPSAVRAGFMQSVLIFAPLVRRENDSVTSLSTALALVLLHNPHAAASVSLQLSFGAIAGIYCFSDGINRALLAPIRSAKARRVLEKPLGVIACSLSVMVITVPLTAVHFGYVSVLAPFMNAAALWAASVCFCAGLAACTLSTVCSVLGVAAAWCCAWVARYIFLVARLISAVPFAVVYLDSDAAVIWLVLCYVFFAGAMFTHLSAARRFWYPLALSAAALAVTLGIMRVGASRGYGTVAVLDVGQGQSISVLSGRASVLIDCGGGAKARRAGETAGAYLLNRGHTRLDALVLTHLHADHANGVEELMELVDVGLLIMPSAPNDDDMLLSPILSAAKAHDTQVVFLEEDMQLETDGIRLSLYAPGESGDTNERCLMCLVSLGEFDLLVTGDAPIKAENELVATHDIRDVEVYIVGHHGSKYSAGDALLSSIGADTAIISVGYNNYGHPTQETLERLDVYGYNVFRTDNDGRVEIRVR